MEPRIVIAYDGSPCADAAIADLRWAGLPAQAQAHVLSVADVWGPGREEFMLPALTKGVLTMVAEARAQAARRTQEARELAQHAELKIVPQPYSDHEALILTLHT